MGDSNTVGDIFDITGQQFLLFTMLAVVLSCIVYTVSQTRGFGGLGALCLAVPIISAGMYLNILEVALIVIVVIIFVYLAVRQFVWKTM